MSAPLLANSFEHTKVTVTSTSIEALAANPVRVSALFINDSGASIYLKFGATAVINEGIRLNGFGGSYELTIQSGTMITDAVNAVGAAGSLALLVLERSNTR